ncbi:NUMOD4 motif-containing HNH endonuclease [Schleiferilactobacillus harbinensis]|uniref:HNH endonuclease n=1 Tax=Schleiferilactobacillus harbinensis TaxID=304207 RepID=A0A5P8M444_9LACO|nr:NUMOD4 motif-containing HNH endonuclease [Schleiferilactobacillus harbinensis]QFR23087.1 HNH endonuclease [Schleiferilactobacillus harbinensis]
MEQAEIWKDIPGFEGRYRASNCGRIKSVDRVQKTARGVRHYKEHLLQPGQYVRSGHVSVVLGHGENGSPVHELVALTFIGPRPPGADIRHLNGNPRDNRVVNLAYGTRTQNILDVYSQGKNWKSLSVSDVQEIRRLIKSGKYSQRKIAYMYQVSENAISSIKHKRTFWWLKEAIT